MTEDTHPDDDSYLVRVKAVVMTRDDSSGGWLAQDGCLSRVGVCRVLSAELLGQRAFFIHGERLKDQQVILECFLKKELVYTKATPTFHHWRVDNRKCGLTFQSPADARAFDRGVRKAVEDLTEGSTTSSSTLQNEAELGDDDVFTNATDSSSSSSSLKRVPVQLFSEPRRHHRCLLGHLYDQRPSDHYLLDQSTAMFPRHVSFQIDEEEIVRINPRERAWLTGYEDYRHAISGGGGDKPAPPTEPGDAYVHFGKSPPSKHDYTTPPSPYPLTCDRRPLAPDPKAEPPTSRGQRDAVVSAQPQGAGGRHGQKEVAGEDGTGGLKRAPRCVYCHDVFLQEENGRGRCQEAPDPVRTGIRRVSFMWCADSLLYHCLSDPEGEPYAEEPCSCDWAGDERFCLRWSALAGLSLVAPCMCCYAPLRACYRCGVACHCCGGRHKAMGGSQ
ncbi:sprouty-related, EVH1 domain-containing protein 2 isoform X2 [Gadus macrocephalus]|uniref:sprouty-related, EVH1 domain-containing protein 2 isoform X2 n=1 Tax=Gadus macrocephalus TaxID=80720 RepID=UPI0028CB4A3D|nr:sprouty-related, EVH1 domain-containing protein 2 isoform X2 [Gadus macrocephalus]